MAELDFQRGVGHGLGRPHRRQGGVATTPRRAFPVVTSLDGTVLFTTGAATVAADDSRRPARSRCPATAAAPLRNARLAALKQLLAPGSGERFVDGANAHRQAGAAAVGDGQSDPHQRELDGRADLRDAEDQRTAQPALPGRQDDRGARGHRRQAADLLRRSSAASIRTATRSTVSRTCSRSCRRRSRRSTTRPSRSASRHRSRRSRCRISAARFQPASGGGTDHAWGNHHFIIGDAVNGGSIYGQYPQLVLGGPSDAEARGPLVADDRRSTSTAQRSRAGSASRPDDLGIVFPNLAKFPSSDLGFMS